MCFTLKGYFAIKVEIKLKIGLNFLNKYIYRCENDRILMTIITNKIVLL